MHIRDLTVTQTIHYLFHAMIRGPEICIMQNKLPNVLYIRTCSNHLQQYCMEKWRRNSLRAVITNALSPLFLYQNNFEIFNHHFQHSCARKYVGLVHLWKWWYLSLNLKWFQATPMGEVKDETPFRHSQAKISWVRSCIYIIHCKDECPDFKQVVSYQRL